MSCRLRLCGPLKISFSNEHHSGCDAAEDLVDCLRSANASALTDAQANVLSIHSDMIYVFQPCIDGLYLTSRIVPALQSNTIAHVPLLFGFVVSVKLPVLPC